jgi:energy-converting hydrogenase Eha subunit H
MTTDNTMLPKGALFLVLPLGNIVLSVVICQALVLVLPLGDIVLSVVIYQILVLVSPFR